MADDPLDPIDARLLALLSADSRQSYARLGRQLNLSRTAVRDRVRSLIRRGVIEAFTVVINQETIGRSLSAFFEIELEPAHLVATARSLAGDEHVLSVDQVTGPSVVHVRAALRDGAHLQRFLQERLYQLPGIVRIKSYVLLHRFKAARPAPRGG